MSKLTKALTAAAGNAGESLYAEDVFSTYLYDGTGAAQTITNDIDLAGEGGLVWIKKRGSSALKHLLYDTERGIYKDLNTNDNSAEDSAGNNLTAFNSDGFSIGNGVEVSSTSDPRVSWTFRKAEKFFDVVTYTGDGVTGRTVSHNLGSVPGFILVKCTSSAQAWAVYHRSEGASSYTDLTTAPFYANPNRWNGTEPTESEFTCGNSTTVNQSGETFVAYLFAHDAGGFGDDGSENIIKCGSYTGSGDTAPYVVSVDLGFEPQWLLVKNATTGGGGKNWLLVDTMRGFHATGADKELRPNTSDAENDSSAFNVTSTGFSSGSGGEPNIQGNTYIYIAIRRPMKTPKSGTEVFAVDTPDSTSPPKYRSSFPVDMAWFRSNINSTGVTEIANRLTGAKYLNTTSTAAEGNQNSYTWDFQNGWYNDQGTETNNRSWMFKRATGFMDMVAYTGTSVAGSKNHNLGVAPELMFVKRRSSGGGQGWNVYAAPLGNTSFITLNTDQSAFTGQSVWNSTTPTDSVFYLSTDAEVNSSSYTYIAYLFATLAGVSKVGSYTGTGSNVDVDCGFSAGARFILIKRTDSTGDWFYWDYERGIVAGNDPYLLLNSTAAQVTNTDYIDPLSSGFTVTSGASFDGLNNSGGNYIFLAIA
jgi:hypothetical protein